MEDVSNKIKKKRGKRKTDQKERENRRNKGKDTQLETPKEQLKGGDSNKRSKGSNE